MPIRFKCQSCNKSMRAPDDYGGVVINCPKCGASIKVPPAEAADGGTSTAASPAKSPAAAAQSSAAAASPSKPSSPVKTPAAGPSVGSHEIRVTKETPFPQQPAQAPAAKSKPTAPPAPAEKPKQKEIPSPAREPDRSEFADFGLGGSGSRDLESDPLGTTADDSASADTSEGGDDDLWSMLASDRQGGDSAGSPGGGLGELDPELAAAAGFDSALGGTDVDDDDEEPEVDASSSSVDSVGIGKELFDDTRLGSNVSPGLSSLDLDEGSIVAPVRERETATADPSRALPPSRATAQADDLSPSFWPALALLDVVLLCVTLYLAAGIKSSGSSVEVHGGTNLATVESVQAAQAAGYMVIEVDAANGLRLGSQPVADLTDLHVRLKSNPPAKVVVVASGDALHETVMAAVAAAQGAGVGEVRLATADK